MCRSLVCLALGALLLAMPSAAGALSHGIYLYHNGVYTPYATAQAAFDAAVPGDAIVYGPGVYHAEGMLKTTKSGTPEAPITIRGEGYPRPVIDMQGVRKNLLPLSHAPIAIQHDYIVVENLEIKNCSRDYGHFINSSGIYTYNANYTTVRNVYIHDCGHGIYASENCTNLTIEHSEFCYNGYANDNYYHNAYINGGGTTVVRYNTWHHCKKGLGYKDRSQNLQFLYNYVFDNGLYELDMMKGGTGPQDALVMGNVILKPAVSDNQYQIIAFTDRQGGTLTFVNNYVQAGSANNTFLHIGAAESCVANNNIFDPNGLPQIDVFFGNEGLSLTGTNNWCSYDAINLGGLTNTVFGATPGLIDPANGNFHLAAGSQCINAGSQSVSPLPDQEPLYLSSYTVRNITPPIDIGPFEYADGAAVAPLPVSGLAATALSKTSVRLTWTNRVACETGFYIERLADETVGWQQIAVAPAGATSYTDDTCQSRKTYLYRVIPFNATGPGGHSNEVKVTTP